MQHIAQKVTNRRGRSLAAFLAAAMLAAPAFRAADLPWVYNDDGSANRSPAIGTSATWQNLFHWEVFTASAQCTVNHRPSTVLIMR